MIVFATSRSIKRFHGNHQAQTCFHLVWTGTKTHPLAKPGPTTNWFREELVCNQNILKLTEPRRPAFRRRESGPFARNLFTRTVLLCTVLTSFRIVFARASFPGQESHVSRESFRASRPSKLCVLSPALNLSKNSCVFPCLNKAIGKTTIPKITRNGQKIPNGDW